ncbi:MAG: branched-chain amino acid ABC transporter permease [Armatimonadota bacterium]
MGILKRLSPFWPYLAVLIIAVVSPLILSSAYHRSVLILIAIYGIMAVGLSLLMGYAGQVSLGHAAFYGLGAYATAIGTTHYGLNPWVCILLGMILTGIVAWFLGKPTLKLHGHYLAMATLGIGIIVQVMFNEGGDFTGGFSGLPNIPRLQIGAFEFRSSLRLCYLAWAILLGVLALSSNIVNSRIGRALRAIHDSEVAARSCGVDVSYLKVMIFVVSAVFAAVAGSLYAHHITFISPDPFGFAFSIMLVVMVLLGGSRNIWGALSGAVIITILNQALIKLADRVPALAGFDVVLFGAILIVGVIYMPEGLAGLLKRNRPEADGAKEQAS